MGGSGWDLSLAGEKLKREDCKRTNHDSLFSTWKVLIGPFDWKDHSAGKEGAERYRIHNLPNFTSCSGIYELGVGVSKTLSGRETSKLDLNHIVPVYIGQADNIRTRLQQYGREGAHLENGKFATELNDSVVQGLRLLSDVFSRGYYILYRCAPMKNKSDAEKAEAQLLDAFDYAWNKESNGVRRPNDVYKKLDKVGLENTRFPSFASKIRIFRPKKMGVRIKACNSNSNLENNNLFTRIFKTGRSRPRNISSRFDLSEDHANICGVSIGCGSVCQSSPLEGRRRCSKHKGMKINGITTKLIAEENFGNNDLYTDLGDKVLFPICGFNLENGTVCDKRPVQGRKRCMEHKGMRITRSCTLIAPGDCDQVFKMHEVDTLESTFSSERAITNKIEISCGVKLSDGTFCTEPPVRGRKRCKEHKGMRIAGSKF